MNKNGKNKMMILKNLCKKQKKGSMLVFLIIIISLAIFMMFPFVSVITSEIKVLRSTVDKEEALQIAEAGINYYQWHLAHFPSDYKDGTENNGPYVHDYKDYDTQTSVGKFSLVITPPPVGSTILKITSTGWTNNNPGIKRTITTRYGVASLTKYAFLSNDIIWIGSSESVGGQLQSNNGVRFDGTGNAPIQSAKSTYMCSVNQGSPCPKIQNGVWGDALQATKNFWQFPVPAVDFSTLTSDLAIMKTAAQTGGIYLSPSNHKGYSLVFNSDGTVTVYTVQNLTNTPKGYDVNGATHNENIDYNKRIFEFTSPIPANGMIFVEDDVWVEGVVKGRVTVAAAELPYGSKSPHTIYIPNNIVYNSKNGNDVLGLLSEKNIIVTYGAPDNLEIDAAMIAQHGSCQIFYYPYDNIKNSITIYGSIMTFGQWTWSWVNNSGTTIISGYVNTYSNYDGNLLYNPPPFFPLSTSGYQLLSWTSD